MEKKSLFKIFGISDINELPSAIMKVLFGDITIRNSIYRELLRINNYDVSYEWFSDVYEAELSERKTKKQDFTPKNVSEICSLLVNNDGTIHEPTAGNGSMLIVAWWQRNKNALPWLAFPSKFMFNCWELSNRSIPILLLNLSIRGMMGTVYHGDVLENKVLHK